MLILEGCGYNLWASFQHHLRDIQLSCKLLGSNYCKCFHLCCCSTWDSDAMMRPWLFCMTTWYQISCSPWTKPRWSWLGAYPAEENASEHTTLLVWPARVVGQRYIPPEGPWLVGLADRGFSVVFGFRFDSFDSISFKMSLQTALHFFYSAKSTISAP